MIVVSLACVLLGGRIEYLRRYAAFHEHEAMRCAEAIKQEQGLPREKIELFLDPEDPFPPEFRGELVRIEESGGMAYSAHIDENFRSYDFHRKLAVEFRAASYRPWTIVREPAPVQ